VNPYAEFASAYLEAGFAPIPASGKNILKKNRHGRDKPWVTEEEVAKWSRLNASANIAARLPRDVIGIDVDAYGSKPGKDTLRALEDELGDLPATVVSTSRQDGVSGIRLFRIPDQYWSVIWPGKAGPGIEIIWVGNRYIIAWPSIHPDTGATYLWFQQDGDELICLDDIPDIAIIPFLPRDWCDHFARVDADEEIADVSNTADWIKSYGAGDMCPQMASNVSRAAEAMSSSAHEAARDGMYGIAKDIAAGHKGGWEASKAVLNAFLAEMGERSHARRASARSEWKRHFDGAIRRAVGSLKGASVPEQDPCAEIADMAGIRLVRRTDSVLWADDVPEVRLDWLQRPLFPFGSLVMLDGDPGQGKSLITETAVANAALGQDLVPFGEHCGRAVKCGIIGAEDDLSSAVVGRLRAAGWERGSRSVAFMKLKRKRGKIEQLTFPDGVERVRGFILEGGLEFLIIDPVTSFLGENVKSHVDASVRAALGPLGQIAGETGCCIVMVRHLNKNGQMQAMYRGGGSIAFSALARSGLITGVVPDSEGRFGLAQVKVNHSRRMPVALTYSIEGWEQDDDIPVVVWHGEAAISADELVAGERAKRGPDSFAQNEVRDVLRQLFDRRDTWPSNAVKSELKSAGATTDQKTVDKVRKDMGILARRVFRRGGIDQWVWTTAPDKLRVRGVDDESR
jgi:hypothetical protein